jgi:uncharacterized protein YndB with AHSA1/START domain
MAIQTTADSESTSLGLTVSRVIDAPRALVFQAWTDPAQVARWWGPKGFVTTHCDMDIRPNGRYRVCMRSPEGTDHWKIGIYREIFAPERIVFTFAWEDAAGRPGNETTITVTFEALGQKTRLTLSQTGFDTIDNRDSHIKGWTSCLERFGEYMVAQS